MAERPSHIYDWKWPKVLGVSDHAGALQTDLSKAFGCIGYELLRAKLNTYGLDRSLYPLTSTTKNKERK